MSKKSIIIVIFFALATSFLFLILSSQWFFRLPFIPEKIRHNFILNASILPARDQSRHLFIAINPGFRAEFGDKDDLTSAFLRFEITPNSTTEQDNADINKNLLDSFIDPNLLFSSSFPGFEWQLFSVGFNEEEIFMPSDTDNHIIPTINSMSDLDLTTTTEVATEVKQALSDKTNITTSTIAERHTGYDVINNLAVASAIDLKYTVKPGKGINQDIIIGDRANFDTACLHLLHLTNAEQGCDLPYNRFSFLLQLDPGQKLIHSPLALENNQTGSYYLLDEENQWLLRLLNPTLIDAQGQTSSQVKILVRPGTLNDEPLDNFYIVTIVADFNWLIDSQRVFPVTIKTGFYTDQQDLFLGEKWQE